MSETIEVRIDTSIRGTTVLDDVQIAVARLCDWREPVASPAGQISLAPVDRPTITAASLHFTLNREQHLAFVLVASAILACILARIDTTTIPAERVRELREAHDRLLVLCNATKIELADSANEQISPDELDSGRKMFAFITGAAGTGKSRVIDAITDFARRWDASDVLCVTATSGAAAALIGARTWHSAVGFRPGSRASEPSALLRRVWCSIGVMLVDEIGMAGVRALWTIDRRLKQLKGVNRRFGGVHFIVFGDFRQLPPVADCKLFDKRCHMGDTADLDDDDMDGASDGEDDQPAAAAVKSGKSKKAKSAGSSASAERINHAGHVLWLGIDAGVELIKNQRASSDAPYADALEAFAVNQPTSAHLALINSRLVTPTNALNKAVPVRMNAAERVASAVEHARLSVPTGTNARTAAPPFAVARAYCFFGCLDGGTPIIVVPRNDERLAVNALMLRKYLQANPLSDVSSGPRDYDREWIARGCIRVDAILSTTDKRTIIPSEWERVRRVEFNGLPKQTKAGEKKDSFDRALCGHLNLVIGEYVMVLRNQNTYSGNCIHRRITHPLSHHSFNVWCCVATIHRI